MELEYLTLDLHYYVNSDKFKVGGNVNEEGQKEIVETFLRDQVGAGEDKRTPDKRDSYHIELKWYPENDRIEASSDTGNDSLRDGILMRYLRILTE